MLPGLLCLAVASFLSTLGVESCEPTLYGDGRTQGFRPREYVPISHSYCAEREQPGTIALPFSKPGSRPGSTPALYSFTPSIPLPACPPRGFFILPNPLNCLNKADCSCYVHTFCSLGEDGEGGRSEESKILPILRTNRFLTE